MDNRHTKPTLKSLIRMVLAYETAEHAKVASDMKHYSNLIVMTLMNLSKRNDKVYAPGFQGTVPTHVYSYIMTTMEMVELLLPRFHLWKLYWAHLDLQHKQKAEKQREARWAARLKRDQQYLAPEMLPCLESNTTPLVASGSSLMKSSVSSISNSLSTLSLSSSDSNPPSLSSSSDSSISLNSSTPPVSSSIV